MTTDDRSTLTRRRLLAGASSIGVLGLTVGRRVAPSRPSTDLPDRYTRYTYAATPDQAGENDPEIRVGWNSTYNGEAVGGDGTETGEETDAGRNESDSTVEPSGTNGGGSGGAGGPRLGNDGGVPGPLIDASNVLPGDSGTVSIGLSVEEMDARVRLFLTDGTGENPVSGALADVIEVALWYDTGILGIGGCRGAESMPENPTIETTLRDLGDRYGPNSDGLLVTDGLEDCLAEGEHFCLGFAWRIDESVTNAYQGTAADFGLAFRAEQCGGGQ
ncbi:hypothetical protein [Halopenitus persicus]|uniref:SipW-cognate class signal peptide n=1 Tax=Halopenitus persicus TaxID=1048396 RepID=A0A1H3M2F1_9EURY|nr:hypothetical protein [Halopenitus persicus]SDY70195.1 hypothetical protein SAMN05216564_10888 [Halopenitus persicus]